MQTGDLVEPSSPVAQTAEGQIAAISPQMPAEQDEPCKRRSRYLKSESQVDDDLPRHPFPTIPCDGLSLNV